MRKSPPCKELGQSFVEQENKYKELRTGRDLMWLRIKRRTKLSADEMRSERQAGARSGLYRFVVRRWTCLSKNRALILDTLIL